jgi:transcriptional regulator with XRE-family HTH domain
VRNPEKRQKLNNDAERAALARALHINRTARGLTIEQLAKKAGVAHTTILGIENGTTGRGLSTRVLVKIANALDIGLIARFVPFSEFVVSSGSVSTAQDGEP